MAIGSEESGFPEVPAKTEQGIQSLQTQETNPAVNHSTALRKVLALIKTRFQETSNNTYPERLDTNPSPNDPAYFLMKTRPMDWFRGLVKKIQNRPIPMPQAI